MHAQHGFTLVEMLLTITILSLVIGVLTDTLILGLRTTKDTQTRIAQSDAQQFIAHYVSKDVLGVGRGDARRHCVRSKQCRARHHRAVGGDTVAPPIRPSRIRSAPTGSSRSTCAVGATSAATISVISDEVTGFTATCASPGACGTVHLDVQTAAGVNVPSRGFTLDVSPEAAMSKSCATDVSRIQATRRKQPCTRSSKDGAGSSATQRGFTLVELLVVVLILGVLAAVVVFSVGGITNRGRNASCVTEVREVRTAIEAFKAQSPTNANPANLAALVTAKLLETAPSASTPSGAAGLHVQRGERYVHRPGLSDRMTHGSPTRRSKGQRASVEEIVVDRR